jgi:hypothetical protein
MNKLNGIKKGDAVEVTFRGRVDCLGPRTLDVIMDGADDPNILWANAIAAPSFSIKEVGPPVAEGDTVIWIHDYKQYEVLAVRDGYAWCRRNGHQCVLPTQSLVRVQT